MKFFLSKLKLIHKINLGVYLFSVLVITIVVVFYIVSNIMTQEMRQNYAKEVFIRKTSDKISQSLKKLDYLSIKNSLNPVENYEKKRDEAYDNIIKNLDILEKDDFFSENKKVENIIARIKKRVNGYKRISTMIRSEMQEDFEDGVYAILALTSTSSIIAKEMKVLVNEIELKSKENSIALENHIHNIRLMVMSALIFFFLFILFLNRKIVTCIANDLSKLQNMISSFFDYLSKKRDRVKHIHFDNDDEIATMANIVDSHIYLAEEILTKEREESAYIEAQVEEATAEIRALSHEIESTQREVVFTMGAIAEERSKETGNHVKRVAEYSLILARLYGLSLEESILIKNASPMHDIGKIGIPDAILNKPGRFTDEEFDIMKSHSEIGYRMLNYSERSILKAAAIIAYEHHERWDGRGYPRGIKGEEIHIYGRITAIADVFDALGSERVYKKAWPLEKILKLFEEERAKQFDPKLVDIFLDNLAHFLAARENIDNMGDNSSLSKYIENFEKVSEF